MKVEKRYAYLPELLNDMPSDEELKALYDEPARGGHRRPLIQRDLWILQLRADGWTYGQIGKELGVSGSAVRTKLSPIKMRLTVDLKIAIDVPGIFRSPKRKNP